MTLPSIRYALMTTMTEIEEFEIWKYAVMQKILRNVVEVRTEEMQCRF